MLLDGDDVAKRQYHLARLFRIADGAGYVRHTFALKTELRLVGLKQRKLVET